MSEPVIAIDARLVAGVGTGDSTYWTGLLHGFTKIPLGFRILLISNTARPPGIPWCDKFEWLEVPGRNGRLWSLLAFPRAARRAGARAIHAQYSLSPLVKRAGITTIHDVSFLIGPEWFRPRDRFLLKRTVPAAAKRAAAVITVSETSKGEIERLIPAAWGKTTATPLACPPWIRPVEEAASVVGEKFGLEPGYLLTVGTRWPRKNMALAVEASDLLAEGIARPLVITGKPGWGEQEMGKRAKAVGYVDADTLSALYSAAGMYLAPSRHEGFGLPLVEAFTCGCPVMCSSGGSFPEVAGDAALVQQSWEPGAWAEAISGALMDSSKLEFLRREGHKRAKQFSWETTARLTAEVYQRVIG